MTSNPRIVGAARTKFGKFRDRSLESLDQPPIVLLDEATNVHIYDPLARTDRRRR